MSNPPPATLFNPGRQTVPPGTGTVGMVLFLIALAMLFASSILGYLLIRFTAADAPAPGTIDLPWGLWVSTGAIMASSLTVHWALQSVRCERQTVFRRWLSVTMALAVLFLVVQTPCMTAIMQDHLPKMRAYTQARQEALAARGKALAMVEGQPAPLAPGMMPIEGLVFLLILIHAVHVIGGVVPLAVVTFKGNRGRYDHENYAPVKYIAMYWHFLDAVWIVMFVTLLVAR